METGNTLFGALFAIGVNAAGLQLFRDAAGIGLAYDVAGQIKFAHHL